MKKAFVVLKNNESWIDDIAVNYSQLSIDHAVSSRLDSEQFDYIIASNFDEAKFNDYDVVIVIDAGAILLYGYYEQFFTDLPLVRKTYLSNGVFAFQPAYEGESHTSLRTIEQVDTTNIDTFAETHSSISTNLINDSNMTYFMHNELPVFGKVTQPLSWAATVSSGFFVNAIMNHHGFTDDCKIHHFDISKISLHVREYTIRNWDGTNVFEWIDHIHDKFPSMRLFNKGKLTERDPSFKRIWKSHIEYFGEVAWKEHWDKYVKLDHSYYRINISDMTSVNQMFKSIDTDKQGAIWWNGSMKRIAANVMKTSNQSHLYSTKFLEKLSSYNNNMICYGSDHCLQQYDGIPAIDCLKLVKMENSRNSLWTHII